MIFEKKQEEVFNEIASLINDIIPVEWEQFSLHGELEDNQGGEVYFFYTVPSNPERFDYCYFIPDQFDVDRKIYDELMHELFDLLAALQQLFNVNQQPLWYSFTMLVNAKREVDAYYEYCNWRLSDFGPSDRIDYFQYKYLNVQYEDSDKNTKMLNMKAYEALNQTK